MKNILNRNIDTAVFRLEELLNRSTESYNYKLENLMVLQGRSLALQNAERAPLTDLHDAEFKVFSQFGEDGILQYLIRETQVLTKENTFIEFGVQDYSESNTRFLLMNDHWKGLIIDGNKEHIKKVKRQDIYWRHDLTAISSWIDRDNINQLIGDTGFSGGIGILSIDIDGNDYWVWEKIDVVNPVIVVVEWNSVYGANCTVTVPYDPAFQRENAHYSCLYWGASISAFARLASERGYSLLCSNRAGNNLFFVRNDRLGRLTPMSPEKAYVESSFRDSRDESGRLNYLGGEKRLAEILDLPVINVMDNSITTLRKLDATTS